ncbi:MAG: LPS export ABC transporter permease LptF [Pseudomonadota bacterium]
MRLAKFDRYMLAQLLVIFGFLAVVLVLVYWVNQAVRLFDFLIGSGQSAVVFLEFTALSLPNVIRIVVPVAAFAATLYVANRLSSESELVVVQSTGYSPFRLARPVAFFGAFVAVFVALLVHLIVPAAHSRLVDRQAEVTENVTARFLVEGQFMHPAPGATIYIREITPTGELRDLFLRDAREENRHVTYTSTRALLLRGENGPRLAMFDGMAQTYSPAGRNLAITRFETLNLDIGRLIDMAAPGSRDARGYRELSTTELLSGDRALAAAAGVSTDLMITEGHRRMTQSMMAFVGPLIGFATLMLAGFSRFGIWNQIFGAVLLIVAIQTFDGAMIDITRETAALWPLIYLPPLVALVLSVAMLWLAAHPGLFRRRPTLPETPG